MSEDTKVLRQLEYERLKKENEERERQVFEEERQIKHALRLVESNIPEVDYYRTFDNFDMTNVDNSQKIVELIQKFIHLKLSIDKKYSNFMTLWGNTGRGKTYLAIAAILDIVENFDAVYWNCPELLELIRKKQFDNTYYEFMERLKNVYFLVLDDYADIKNTEFVTEKLDLLINYRYENQKLTLVTTNKTPEELMRFNKRVASRLASGIMVELIGKDYRMKMVEARKVK